MTRTNWKQTFGKAFQQCLPSPSNSPLLIFIWLILAAVIGGIMNIRSGLIFVGAFGLTLWIWMFAFSLNKFSKESPLVKDEEPVRTVPAQSSRIVGLSVRGGKNIVLDNVNVLTVGDGINLDESECVVLKNVQIYSSPKVEKKSNNKQRALSSDQVSVLVRSLKPFAGYKTLRIGCAKEDKEAEIFATQLGDTVKTVGIIPQYCVVSGLGERKGMLLLVKDGAEANIFAKVLLNSLIENGITVDFKQGPTLIEDSESCVLLVCPKPN